MQAVAAVASAVQAVRLVEASAAVKADGKAAEYAYRGQMRI